MFLPLHDVYEPAAILPLPDGRFLIVEDEKVRPFSLVTICPDGTTHSVPLVTETPGGDFAKLDENAMCAIFRRRGGESEI